MKKRRANGEGSIFPLPNGHWRAQVSVSGRRLSKTAPTQREVREWLRKTISQVEDGLSYDATRTTVTEFLDGFLARRKNDLRPNTHTGYTQIARDHIKPYIGKRKLSQLRPDHVQAMYDQLIANGVGARTVEIAHVILHSALEHARQIQVLTKNVSEHVLVPKAEKRKVEVLTEEETSRLFAAINGHRYQVMIIMAALTGMRRGELFGLKWSDLDWLTGQVHISRQAQSVRGKGNLLVPVKTEASNRTITIAEQLLELLRAHYQQQQLVRQFAGDRWQEHDLIFPSLVGTPLIAANFNKEWWSIKEMAGLDKRQPPFTFHQLRHLNASLHLVKLKKSAHEVSRILGHSRVSITTDIYGHWLPGSEQQTARELEALLLPVEVDLAAPALHPRDED